MLAGNADDPFMEASRSRFMGWEDFPGPHFRCCPILKAFQNAALASKFSGAGQVNILRRASRSQPEFHGVATLEQPGCVWFRKQPREQPIKRHLPAQALEIDALGLGERFEPSLQGDPL